MSTEVTNKEEVRHEPPSIEPNVMAPHSPPPGFFKSFVAGGVGGSCLVIVGQPMDLIKVRLQSMPLPAPGQAPMYTGTWDCLTKTVRNEGYMLTSIEVTSEP